MSLAGDVLLVTLKTAKGTHVGKETFWLWEMEQLSFLKKLSDGPLSLEMTH